MNTLAPSFLNQSSSFLQVTRTCMKAWMSSNFGQIPTPTQELLLKSITTPYLSYINLMMTMVDTKTKVKT